MIAFEKNSKKYLYHYTKIDTALEYILKSGSLRVGRMKGTNDPKESKNWLFDIGSNNGADLSGYDIWKLSEELDYLIKTKTFLLCFSRDQNLSGDHIKDITKRGYGHSRMWAQYAQNHTGLCLIFDNELLGNSFHKSFYNYTYYAQSINYIDRFIGEKSDSSYTINIDYLEKLGLEDYAITHADTYKNRLFFEKLEDWKNENEYRWILFGETGMEEPIFTYDKALRGIVFGASCSDDNIKKTVDLTRDLGLDYMQLKWRNCSPWYDFEKWF